MRMVAEVPTQFEEVVKYGVWARGMDKNPYQTPGHGVGEDTGESEDGMRHEISACCAGRLLRQDAGRIILPLLTVNGGKLSDLILSPGALPDGCNLQIRGNRIIKTQAEFVFRHLPDVDKKTGRVTKDADSPDDIFVLTSTKRWFSPRFFTEWIGTVHGWLYGHEIMRLAGAPEPRLGLDGKPRKPAFFLAAGYGKDPAPLFERLRAFVQYPTGLPPSPEKIPPHLFFRDMGWADRK